MPGGGADLIWVHRLGLCLLAAVCGESTQVRLWGLGCGVWGQRSSKTCCGHSAWRALSGCGWTATWTYSPIVFLSKGRKMRSDMRLVNTLCRCANATRMFDNAHRAQVVRMTFAREVVDERDARSTLTMLAQLAWERERNYVPVVPQIPDPVGK